MATLHIWSSLDAYQEGEDPIAVVDAEKEITVVEYVRAYIEFDGTRPLLVAKATRTGGADEPLWWIKKSRGTLNSEDVSPKRKTRYMNKRIKALSDRGVEEDATEPEATAPEGVVLSLSPNTLGAMLLLAQTLRADGQSLEGFLAALSEGHEVLVRPIQED